MFVSTQETVAQREDHHRTQKIDTVDVRSVLRLLFVSNRLHGIQRPTISVHCADCTQKHSHCSFVPFVCTKNDSTVVYDNTIGSSPEREIYAIAHRDRKRYLPSTNTRHFFPLNNLCLKNDLTKYIEILIDAK